MRESVLGKRPFENVTVKLLAIAAFVLLFALSCNDAFAGSPLVAVGDVPLEEGQYYCAADGSAAEFTGISQLPDNSIGILGNQVIIKNFVFAASPVKESDFRAPVVIIFDEDVELYAIGKSTITHVVDSSFDNSNSALAAIMFNNNLIGHNNNSARITGDAGASLTLYCYADDISLYRISGIDCFVDLEINCDINIHCKTDKDGVFHDNYCFAVHGIECYNTLSFTGGSTYINVDSTNSKVSVGADAGTVNIGSGREPVWNAAVPKLFVRMEGGLIEEAEIRGIDAKYFRMTDGYLYSGCWPASYETYGYFSIGCINAEKQNVVRGGSMVLFIDDSKIHLPDSTVNVLRELDISMQCPGSVCRNGSASMPCPAGGIKVDGLHYLSLDTVSFPEPGAVLYEKEYDGIDVSDAILDKLNIGYGNAGGGSYYVVPAAAWQLNWFTDSALNDPVAVTPVNSGNYYVKVKYVGSALTTGWEGVYSVKINRHLIESAGELDFILPDAPFQKAWDGSSFYCNAAISPRNYDGQVNGKLYFGGADVGSYPLTFVPNSTEPAGLNFSLIPGGYPIGNSGTILRRIFSADELEYYGSNFTVRKTFDGSTAAGREVSVKVKGLDVYFTGRAAFNDYNAGTDKPLSAHIVPSTEGNSTTNYTVEDCLVPLPSGCKGTIDPISNYSMSLHYTTVYEKTSKFYDGTTDCGLEVFFYNDQIPATPIPKEAYTAYYEFPYTGNETIICSFKSGTYGNVKFESSYTTRIAGYISGFTIDYTDEASCYVSGADIPSGTVGTIASVDLSQFVAGKNTYIYEVNTLRDSDGASYSYNLNSETGMLRIMRDKARPASMGRVVGGNTYYDCSICVTEVKSGLTRNLNFKVGEFTAGAGVIRYETFVNGVQITSTNMADVCGDGKVSYFPAESASPAVLTLNNAVIDTIATDWLSTPGYSDVGGGGILTGETLEIQVMGENTISLAGVCDCYEYNGASAEYMSLSACLVGKGNDISLTGSGKLMLRGAKGIYTEGDVQLCGCNVDVETDFGVYIGGSGGLVYESGTYYSICLDENSVCGSGDAYYSLSFDARTVPYEIWVLNEDENGNEISYAPLSYERLEAYYETYYLHPKAILITSEGLKGSESNGHVECRVAGGRKGSAKVAAAQYVNGRFNGLKMTETAIDLASGGSASFDFTDADGASYKTFLVFDDERMTPISPSWASL